MFIFKSIVQIVGQGRRNRFVVADDFKVFPVERTRATGKSIAGFTEVTGTGQNRKDIITISAEGTSGHGSKRTWRNYVKRTSADIKDSVRRVRPEEQAIIAQHDFVIAELEEALKTARLARAEAVAEAWSKAHVVTLKEVTEKLS